MTGEDSYHAHCFKCKVCKNRIDDLVFAKTSQGIYCMDCHNQRMARIRKHNERKSAQRNRENGLPHSPNYSEASPDPRSPPKRPYGIETPKSSPGLPPQSISVTPAAPSPVFHPPPRESSFLASEQVRSTPAKQSTLPLPPTEDTSVSARRKSYDDGTRPLDILYKSLDAPTPRRDKRRSINPGLTLKDLASAAPNTNITASSSPTSLSPHSAGITPNRSPTPPKDSPLHSNPSSRPSSFGHSSASDHDHRKASSNTQDPTVAMRSSESLATRFSVSLNGDHHRSPSPRGQQRLSVNSARSRSRSSSRAADVPQGIESGTDDDDDDREQHHRTVSVESAPPELPPKEARTPTSRSALQSPQDPDASQDVAQQDSSDDMSESSPVEQTSHATFIAPALPPIRFSMNTGDFDDLFKSNEALEQDNDNVPLTPPPSASSYHSNGIPTPTSDVTVIGSSAPSSTPDLHADGTLSQLPVRQASLRATPSLSDSSSSSTRARSSSDSTHITITGPGSRTAHELKQSSTDLVLMRLQEALTDAKERGAQQLKFDRAFVEAIITTVHSKKDEYTKLKSRFDGINRASKQYIEGLTVAQTEYDKELKARRDSEAEVTRLRVLLSGQAARLTALSGDSRRQELRQQLTKDLHNNLSGLEQDLSKLKVQRDMTLAEVEELAAGKSTAEPANINRSLTVRLEKLRREYQKDLVPLTEQREALVREIAELKATRDVFLEETTALNARNEELAQLSAQYTRRMDTVMENQPLHTVFTPPKPSVQQQVSYPRPSTDDDTADLRYIKVPKPEVDQPTPSKKFIKWPTRTKEVNNNITPLAQSENRGKSSEHNFQQMSILRFTRCDHCQDKMWGSQLRCLICNISVHTRCVNHVQVACSQNSHRDESIPLPPSMFGRDLIEQVYADARGGSRQVPVLVEKCIEAVEAIALDYEGIYRKTGGTGQTRLITQLFERGDYDAFDLCDSERFNDICSVTSVLKTYFRNLPVPLLTFELHDRFMSAVEIRDISLKAKTLTELVNKLPSEHYQTLKTLMLHLHNVYERRDINLMSAQNLGVVFGPTLMRSPVPGAEFSDMAGKALSIEWLVENAPNLFT